MCQSLVWLPGVALVPTVAVLNRIGFCWIAAIPGGEAPRRVASTFMYLIAVHGVSHPESGSFVNSLTRQDYITRACWHQDTARISISAAVDNESSAHLCFGNWVFILQSHFGAVGEVLTRCGTLRSEVLQLRSCGSLMTPLHRAPYVIKTLKGALYDPLINHLYPFGVSIEKLPHIPT